MMNDHCTELRSSRVILIIIVHLVHLQQASSMIALAVGHVSLSGAILRGEQFMCRVFSPMIYSQLLWHSNLAGARWRSD